jgi:hypothetical protein
MNFIGACEDGTDSTPKRRHIKFVRRGINQKKAYKFRQTLAGLRLMWLLLAAAKIVNRQLLGILITSYGKILLYSALSSHVF